MKTTILLAMLLSACGSYPDEDESTNSEDVTLAPYNIIISSSLPAGGTVTCSSGNQFPPAGTLARCTTTDLSTMTLTLSLGGRAIGSASLAGFPVGANHDLNLFPATGAKLRVLVIQ